MVIPMVFYILCLIWSALNLGAFVITKKKNESSLFVGLFLLIVVANMGYLFLGLSDNVGEALTATRVVYIGGQFLPAILLMIISRFVGFKYHNILSAVCLTCGFAMFAITNIGIECGDIYYKSVSYCQENGVAYLAKEYGPLRLAYTIYAIIAILTMVGFLIYAFAMGKKISYKNTFYLVAIVVTTSAFQFISRSFIPYLDLIPAAYGFSGTVLFLLIRRINIYNLDGAAAINLDNKEFYGCIGFDMKRNYVGSNADADALFPEVAALRIDHPLPAEGDLFAKLSKLLGHLEKCEKAHAFYIERGEKVYKITAQRNKVRNKDHGYFVEIVDDTRQVRYQERLKKDVEIQTQKNALMQQKLLVNMADMINTRDESTGGHVKRTSDLINLLVESLKKNNVYGESFDFYEAVRRAAPMHDLGKLTISEEILNKPGRFTPEEFEIMKSHSVWGEGYVAAICKDVEDEEFIEIAKHVARSHHEKYGGGGYPDNLKGEQIPVEARIMALADVYDALVSKRCYKAKMSFEDANRIIEESFGPHFDPALKPVYEDCRPQWEAYYKEVNE